MYNKTGQVRTNVTLSSVPVTTVAMKNAKLLHILSVVYVALAIPQAKCMHRIILSPVARLALTHFSIYLINGTIFRKSY